MSMQSDPLAPPTQEPQEKKKWVEPVTALLMALATLSTAWCSYQSAAWTRKSNRLMNEFNSLERKAGLVTMQGMQQATIHTAMFMQWLAARQAGNDKLADFYVERFPPDMRKAYDAWMIQKPFENPSADPHPFVPNLYQLRGTLEAADANAKAASSLREARNAGNVSGQYLANTVLFATVLFFASASGKFEQRRVRTRFHLRSGSLRICGRTDDVSSALNATREPVHSNGLFFVCGKINFGFLNADNSAQTLAMTPPLSGEHESNRIRRAGEPRRKQ